MHREDSEWPASPAESVCSFQAPAPRSLLLPAQQPLCSLAQVLVTCNTGLGAPLKILTSICPWLPDLYLLLSPKACSAQLITNRYTHIFSKPVPSLLQLCSCCPQKPASHAYLYDSPRCILVLNCDFYLIKVSTSSLSFALAACVTSVNFSAVLISSSLNPVPESSLSQRQ